MQFRNFKMVDYVVYGRGAFNQVDEIIAPHRKGDFPMIPLTSPNSAFKLAAKASTCVVFGS